MSKSLSELWGAVSDAFTQSSSNSTVAKHLCAYVQEFVKDRTPVKTIYYELDGSFPNKAKLTDCIELSNEHLERARCQVKLKLATDEDKATWILDFNKGLMKLSPKDAKKTAITSTTHDDSFFTNMINDRTGAPFFYGACLLGAAALSTGIASAVLSATMSSFSAAIANPLMLGLFITAIVTVILAAIPSATIIWVYAKKKRNASLTTKAAAVSKGTYTEPANHPNH